MLLKIQQEVKIYIVSFVHSMSLSFTAELDEKERQLEDKALEILVDRTVIIAKTEVEETQADEEKSGRL